MYPQIITADAYVGALDVPGAKKMIPESWRSYKEFDNIHKLVGVPVITVQLRYDGWVTEMEDVERAKNVKGGAIGIDNLLYRCGWWVVVCGGGGVCGWWCVWVVVCVDGGGWLWWLELGCSVACTLCITHYPVYIYTQHTQHTQRMTTQCGCRL